MRFAGHTAAGCQPDAADPAARGNCPWPRSNEPEGDIELREKTTNA